MGEGINTIRFQGKEYAPYVNDYGIYAPVVYGDRAYYQCVMTKEMFVEAYNKWIKSGKHVNYGKDDVDCWCE